MSTDVGNEISRLKECLDDLCVRFIINLPMEELKEMPRIAFQIEEAQWFYEDFIRHADNTLPHINLKEFFYIIFDHCPILHGTPADKIERVYDEFMMYKQKVPVRGGIILNETLDKVLLVKGWKKASTWTFPRGKINKNETALECAIREIDEETGFNIRDAGYVPANLLSISHAVNSQDLRLFIFPNIPESTVFSPKTRKEISDVRWWRLADLPGWRRRGPKPSGELIETDATPKPSRFYVVAPFLVELKRLMPQLRRQAPPTARLEELQAEEFDVRHTEVGLATDNDEPALQPPYDDDETLITPKPEEPDVTQLKRMLNIAGPESPVATSRPAATATNSHAGVPVPPPRFGHGMSDADRHRSNLLMAMLHGHTPSDTPNPLPLTPLEHVQTQVPKPSTPRPHYTSQPAPNFSPFAAAPVFNLDGAGDIGSGKTHLAQPPIPSAFDHTPQVSELENCPAPIAELQQQQQRYGSYSQSGPSVQVPVPVHPGSASKQPLNAQSRALLNIFKGATPVTTIPKPELQHPSRDQTPRPTQPVAQAWSPSSTLPSDNTRKPSMREPQLPPQFMPPVPPPPTRPMLPPGDAHRSALLNLFNSPSPALVRSEKKEQLPCSPSSSNSHNLAPTAQQLQNNKQPATPSVPLSASHSASLSSADTRFLLGFISNVVGSDNSKKST